MDVANDLVTRRSPLAEVDDFRAKLAAGMLSQSRFGGLLAVEEKVDGGGLLEPLPESALSILSSTLSSTRKRNADGTASTACPSFLLPKYARVYNQGGRVGIYSRAERDVIIQKYVLCAVLCVDGRHTSHSGTSMREKKHVVLATAVFGEEKHLHNRVHILTH